jgi:hypothetical protein
MISESYYWRDELLKTAIQLKKRNKIIKWTDSENGEFEKEIMIGFFIIRKLIEASKLTNKLISTNIKGYKYPSNGQHMTFMNNHRFHEFYDLEKRMNNTFDIKFLINQFVHSYIFYPLLDIENSEIRNSISDNISDEEYSKLYFREEKTIVGIWFNSDENKNEFLYEIKLNKIINLFEQVGKCNITRASYVFNPKKNDFDISLSDEEVTISEELQLRIKEIEENNNR